MNSENKKIDFNVKSEDDSVKTDKDTDADKTGTDINSDKTEIINPEKEKKFK
jgi:hypothetical protein